MAVLRPSPAGQLLSSSALRLPLCALFDSLSVWENVAFGLIQGRGVARSKAREVAIEKLGQVGLGPEVGNLYPAELSGGMQKRVGLARAIAADPEIIFFDEPTTGLDPIMADVINDLIVQCVKNLGATALSITHDMASARKIADEIAANAPIAVQAIKRTIDMFADRGLDDALRFEAMNAAVGFVSEDLIEGFASGRDKRPPRFEGK